MTSATHPAVDDRPSATESDPARRLCAQFGVTGNSPRLLDAVLEVQRAQQSDAPVLLLGESGTGKELFARMIHQTSLRRAGPYVALNCAAIPSPLLESELFGHEKGSFTGAHARREGRLRMAGGGTLFLDEIGDLEIGLQVKLLRVLQERRIDPVGGVESVPVDFRLVTATHVNLLHAVEVGAFRLDLFFRLNVIPIALPSLRERAEDIPLLAEVFLERFSSQYGRRIGFAHGVLDRLRDFPWPGNIRQLQNVIERAVIQTDGHVITPRGIEQMLSREAAFTFGTSTPDSRREPASSSMPVSGNPQLYRPYSRVDASQRAHIEQALCRAGGNRTRAAAMLGLTPRQLRYKLVKLSIGSGPGDQTDR